MVLVHGSSYIPRGWGGSELRPVLSGHSRDKAWYASHQDKRSQTPEPLMFRKPKQASLDSRPGEGDSLRSDRREDKILMHSGKGRVDSEQLSRDPVTCSAITPIECGIGQPSEHGEVLRVGDQELVAEISRQSGKAAFEQKVDESDHIVHLAKIQFLLARLENLLSEFDQ